MKGRELAFAMLLKLPRTAARNLVRTDKSKKTRERLKEVYRARDERRAFELIDWQRPAKTKRRPVFSGAARKHKAKNRARRRMVRKSRRANRAA